MPPPCFICGGSLTAGSLLFPGTAFPPAAVNDALTNVSSRAGAPQMSAERRAEDLGTLFYMEAAGRR